jgi:hypothetical protein
MKAGQQVLHAELAEEGVEHYARVRGPPAKVALHRVPTVWYVQTTNAQQPQQQNQQHQPHQ